MDSGETAQKPTDIVEGLPPVSTAKAMTAFCPKSNGAMTANESVCPHCDFPFTSVQRGPSLAFSRFADVVLIIAAAIASLAWVVSLIGAVVTLVAGEFGASLFLLTWSFIVLALAIVFLRVQRMEPRDPGKGDGNSLRG